jgi:hypothetical protein
MLTSGGSTTAISRSLGASPRGRFAERLKGLGRGIEIVETTRLSLRLGRRGCIFPDVFHHTRDRLNYLRIKITGCVPPDFGQAASATASHRHVDGQRFGHGNSESGRFSLARGKKTHVK